MSVQGSYSVPVCQLPLASSSEVIFWSSCHFLRKERREKEEKKKENFPNRCCIFYCIMRLCVMRTQDCIIAFSEFIHNIGSHYSGNTRTVYKKKNTTAIIGAIYQITRYYLKRNFVSTASF